MTKNMVKNDQKFICENCRKEVQELKYTSRDHCPNCLYSKHVDVIPGDRENICKGLLKPVGYKIQKGKEQIVYRCLKCNEIRNNIVAKDDNRDLIIELTTKEILY